MKYLYLFGLALVLFACAAPAESIPAPTPEPITIVYPTALQSWAEALANCAANDSQVALYFMPSNSLGTPVYPNELELELGDPGKVVTDAYLSQVGWEQVVVVVNAENHLTQLTDSELRSIFSGQVNGSLDSSGNPFQVWVFPDGDPVRLIFDSNVMQGQSIATDVMLAPDVGAMLETISENVDAIGYAPQSFITISDPSIARKVKIIQLETTLEALLLQPVIAMTQGEPTGSQRNLLVCLESTTPK